MGYAPPVAFVLSDFDKATALNFRANEASAKTWQADNAQVHRSAHCTWMPQALWIGRRLYYVDLYIKAYTRTVATKLTSLRSLMDDGGPFFVWLTMLDPVECYQVVPTDEPPTEEVYVGGMRAANWPVTISLVGIQASGETLPTGWDS